MKDNKRLHFGVVFSNLDDPCQYDIWTGIVEFAHKRNIDLTAYIGIYQTTNDDLTMHFETCLNLISNSGSLDGVIFFSGFIASTIGENELEKYIVRISDVLPLISVSYVVPGISSVLVDNKVGIIDAVEHLIKVHGKKHIAFIKGPDGHNEAEDRFEGYKNALTENGITYDERYVFPGNFTHHGGQLAVRMLLENPDISADAIVTCDDSTAVGALNELKAQNILVPVDIAVASFDDERGSDTFIPSISTVRQDFHNIGYLSAEVLHKKIEGKQVEDVTYMSPVFITRQSCGCLEVKFTDTEIKSLDMRKDADSLDEFVICRLMMLFGQSTPELKIREWSTALVKVIKEKPFSKDRFLHLFNEVVISNSQYSDNVLVWNDVLNVLTKAVEIYRGEVDNIHTILSTIINATSIMQEVRFKTLKIKENEESDNRVRLRRIASNIVSKFDMDSLVNELYTSLPELSLKSVVIGLYQTPIKSNDAGANREIESFVGVVNDKIFNIHNDEPGSTRTHNYAKIDKLFFKNRSDLFIMPLFFKDEEYGVMLVPYDPDIPVETYETLRVNISTAIKGAGLIKEVGNQNELLNIALEQATEASKAKSAFLSAMSHEMRTPMNAIIGMTTIGKKAANIEEKNYTLEKIEDASSHLLGVISDVLDMAKIEANKLTLSPVEFNFDKMLQKALSIVNFRAAEKKQTLSVSVDSRVPKFIISDDQRLTQVITNLLSNAVKFTPEGGEIILEIALIKESEKNCELCISITDNGIGISPEQQENIFRAFEQAESGTSRKFGGTGLGLVISKRIIELMGGRIWVESELGKGAKFSFIINVLSGESIDRSPNAHNIDPDQTTGGIESGALAGKKVLLVEDIEINREIFLALLGELELIIDCAENGKEALDMIETDPDKYDIIFMDLQMPVMGGCEATRLIRKLPALEGVDLPIIAMTANVFKSDIEECLAAGMNSHLGKPFDLDQLLQTLEIFLLP